MRVLVLGAPGFVGRHVVDHLVASGHQVVAGLRPGRTVPAYGQGVEPVVVDPVVDPEGLRTVLRQELDGVINAAGKVGGTRAEMVGANALLVGSLLDGLKSLPRGGRPRLVHVGSAAEYDPPVGRTPVPTGHPTNPSGPYGITKLCGTKLVVAALRDLEVAGTVIRLFNPIGPGSPANTLAGSAERRLREAVDGGLNEIHFGDLDAARDFIDVRDAAELLVKACEHQGDLPEVMNAGTGVSRQAWDVVFALTRGAEWSGSVVGGGTAAPRSRVRWQAADISTTRGALDWSPRHTLEETMRDQWLAGSPAPDVPAGT